MFHEICQVTFIVLKWRMWQTKTLNSQLMDVTVKICFSSLKHLISAGCGLSPSKEIQNKWVRWRTQLQPLNSSLQTYFNIYNLRIASGGAVHQRKKSYSLQLQILNFHPGYASRKEKTRIVNIFNLSSQTAACNASYIMYYYYHTSAERH